MEVTMRIVLFIAVLAAGLLLDGRASYALYQGPWCAVQTLGSDTAIWNCRMHTFEECRLEVVAGNRGHCTQNPNWPGWYGAAGAAAIDAPQPVRRRRAR
jgi:hypothetical protein